MLDSSTGSRSGKALIPRGTPSGEQGSIRQVAPGRGWTSSFLGTKHWKKPETDSIITRTAGWMEAPETPQSATCARIACADVAAKQQLCGCDVAAP